MAKMDPLIHVIDNKEIHELLTWILGTIGLKVAGHQNFQDFLIKYNPLQPGCLLLDIPTTEVETADFHDSIKTEGIPVLPIIFMSSMNDISLAVKVMKEGAADFLLKPFNEEILIDGINRALKINASHLKNLQEIYQTRNKYHHLSRREKQIFHCIVDGKSNKAISQEFNISLKTVEAHRASMMRKMEVKSVSKLVKLFYTVLQEHSY